MSTLHYNNQEVHILAHVSILLANFSSRTVTYNVILLKIYGRFGHKERSEPNGGKVKKADPS